MEEYKEKMSEDNNEIEVVGVMKNKSIRVLICFLVLFTIIADIICVSTLFTSKKCVICDQKIYIYGEDNYSKTDNGYFCEMCAIEYYNQDDANC